MEYRLGKLPPKIDNRTITLRSVWKDRVVPPVPDIVDVDARLGLKFLPQMWGNDRLGDCVICSVGNATKRFEGKETGSVIAIADRDVEDYYFKLTGGPDTGLVWLNTLKDWRKNGFRVRDATYKIYSFAKLDFTNLDEWKASLYYLQGVCAGIALPLSAQAQIGGLWDVDNSPSGQAGSWGLHAVYFPKCDLVNDRLTCVTWGAFQEMTREFVLKYVDEAYGIVDDKNKPDSPIDPVAMEEMLKEITDMPDPGPPVPPPAHHCWFCDFWSKFFTTKDKMSQKHPVRSFWRDPYRWLWSRIGGRKWTYIVRDFAYQNPLVLIILFFLVGYYMRQLFHSDDIPKIGAGLLLAHLFWGTKWHKGQGK